MAILSSIPVPTIRSVRRTDESRGVHRHGIELDAFLRHVAEAFSALDGAGAGAGDLLSLRWIGNLLDMLLSCFEGFRAVIIRAEAGALEAAPMARILADFFDRGVKALDVCSAVRDGASEIRERRRHLGAVAASIGCGGGGLSEGRLRRARKALAELALDAIGDAIKSDDAPRRRRSFGKEEERSHRTAGSGGGGAHQRSQTWSVSLSWPGARQQIQGISFPAAPREHEMVATEGVAEAVYAMGLVLAVVMGALAAALPSSSPQLAAATRLSVPRGFAWWSAPIVWIHERILEESKKRKEGCSSAALLKESRVMERRSHRLMDLIDAAQSPVSGEEEARIRLVAEKLREASEAVEEEELERVEKQIRAVFQSIMRLRKEGLDGSPKTSLLSSPL